MKKITTRQIVITGLFLALEIIFQVIGNYLHIGPININISLITIVLAAAMCGPLSGGVVGFFNGIMALFSPDTLAYFMPVSPGGTILACLLKCTVAGVVAGFIFKAFKKKHKVGSLLLSGFLVPVINTTIFVIFCLIFFRPFLESGVGEKFPNIGAFLIFGVVSWNFIFELISTVVLSVTVGLTILSKEPEVDSSLL